MDITRFLAITHRIRVLARIGMPRLPEVPRLAKLPCLPRVFGLLAIMHSPGYGGRGSLFRPQQCIQPRQGRRERAALPGAAGAGPGDSRSLAIAGVPVAGDAIGSLARCSLARGRIARNGQLARCPALLCTGRPQPAEVPQHHQPEPERDQEEHPRYDRDHDAGGLGRQRDVRGMEGITYRDRHEKDQQGRPGVGPGPPSSLAQRQGGGARDHQHRVDHERIEPGEFGCDTGVERDLVDSFIRKNESRSG
jgi:hypothetical protein